MAHDPAHYRLETADGTVVADDIAVADTLGSRSRGLLGRRSLAEGTGIVIKPCNSIHMFFMQFAIDVAFMSGDGHVLHLCHSIKPWRISRIVGKATCAIEIGAGSFAKAGVTVGDELRLLPRA